VIQYERVGLNMPWALLPSAFTEVGGIDQRFAAGQFPSCLAQVFERGD
jgi:hypothetical protein